MGKQREKIEEVEKGRVDKESFIKNKDELENKLDELVSTAKTEKDKIEIMKYAWKQ
ncbi:hypothetical protein [Thermobrachium celere]|uniref:Uncharacterized protein n=1 Tax=Thermobrachium celere DSM 8682 TaxID=941824 RepID=R7RRR3_9CLOT|nr:hypothetical protein [Thermobrachium celere]CDF58749.1 hypothetical protein TCEL_00968 [Thermobrachium celere DSM 8682]